MPFLTLMADTQRTTTPTANIGTAHRHSEEEFLSVALGPLKSHILIGPTPGRRGASANLCVSDNTRRGPRHNRIVTINTNGIDSGNRHVIPSIGINSRICCNGFNNGRIGISNRSCLLLHTSSVCTIVRNWYLQRLSHLRIVIYHTGRSSTGHNASSGKDRR